MLNLHKREIDFLKKHLENVDVDKLIEENKRNELLSEIYDIIMYKGFDSGPDDDYDHYNAFGEEAQDMYDTVLDVDII